MLDLFENLMGTYTNTYSDMISFFFCSVVVIFTVTSFLQFMAALFKRD